MKNFNGTQYVAQQDIIKFSERQKIGKNEYNK